MTNVHAQFGAALQFLPSSPSSPAVHLSMGSAVSRRTRK